MANYFNQLNNNQFPNTYNFGWNNHSNFSHCNAQGVKSQPVPEPTFPFICTQILIETNIYREAQDEPRWDRANNEDMRYVPPPLYISLLQNGSTSHVVGRIHCDTNSTDPSIGGIDLDATTTDGQAVGTNAVCTEHDAGNTDDDTDNADSNGGSTKHSLNENDESREEEI